MKPFYAYVLAGLVAILAAPVSAHAKEIERLGPFVRTEPDKTTLITLICGRQPGQLNCQFAATQIGKTAKAGECYVVMNAYPVSLKVSGDGRWTATTVVPQCRTGRTDYKLELDEKDKSSLARLVISGCDATPSVFAYDAKGINWTPACTALTTMNDPDTINRIRQSK